METFRKSFETELTLNKGKREVLAIISTKSIDRDGEIVLPAGLMKKNVAGLPVLVNHNWESLPVGKCLWAKPDGDRVISKYVVSDKTQLARDVWGLLEDGVLSSHSMGFRSLAPSPPTLIEKRADPEWETARLVHREWELLELSLVGVPCNSEALTLAISKGLSAETVKILQGEEGARLPISEMKSEDRVGDLSPIAIRRAADRVKSIRVDRLIAAAVTRCSD